MRIRVFLCALVLGLVHRFVVFRGPLEVTEELVAYPPRPTHGRHPTLSCTGAREPVKATSSVHVIHQEGRALSSQFLDVCCRLSILD